jgi:mannan endo-1,4-beta-mannosidase
MMFDYFTNQNGLNNLLWVWNTNAPRNIPGDEAFDYELFYPGGEYVDILAADVYHNDYKQSHHDDIVKLAQGRPVSMGEVGQMPSAETLENQPFWSWFMPWGNLGIKWNDEELIKNLYNSPRVISLEDLEISKDGKFSIVEKINRN